MHISKVMGIAATRITILRESHSLRAVAARAMGQEVNGTAPHEARDRADGTVTGICARLFFLFY